MSARRKSSSRTKSSARESLSERDIVQAALRMLQREGAQSLSMRQLAAELRVTPMAIYYHVPHKRALVERITDSLLESVPMPEPTGVHWEREIKTVTIEGWQRLAAYPGLVAAVLDLGRPSKVGREMLRYNTAVMLAAGFDQPTAMLATTAYTTFVYGVMAAHVQRGKPQYRRKRGKSSGAGNYMAQLDGRELMEYGLDLLLTGLRTQLPHAKRPDGTAKAKLKRPRAQQQPD